jgi:hypothetical protein
MQQCNNRVKTKEFRTIVALLRCCHRCFLQPPFFFNVVFFQLAQL